MLPDVIKYVLSESSNIFDIVALPWNDVVSDNPYHVQCDFSLARLSTPGCTERHVDTDSASAPGSSGSAELPAIEDDQTASTPSEQTCRRSDQGESLNPDTQSSSVNQADGLSDPLTFATGAENTIRVKVHALTRREAGIPQARRKRLRKGFSSLASIWNPGLVSASPVLSMYHAVDPEKARSMRQNGSTARGRFPKSALLRITQDLEIEELATNEVSMLVSFDVQTNVFWYPEQETPPELLVEFDGWFAQYARIFTGLEDTFRSAFDGLATTPDTVVLKQLGLLRCYFVNLILVTSFLADKEAEYDLAESQGRQHRNPRRPILSRRNLAGIALDASFHENLANEAANVSAAIEGLLDLLATRFPEPLPIEFRRLSVELRSMCASAIEMAERFKTRLDTYMKLGEIHRAIKDSNSVYMLSFLAAVFLPLSLATGILNMNTRFVRLGSLLYDFVGVVLLLMTLVIAIVVARKLVISVGRMLIRLITVRLSSSMRHPLRDPLRDPLRLLVKDGIRLTTYLNAFVFWLVLLTSFLVGMIKDIDLGWRILGYGVGAFTGLYVLLLLLVGVVTTISKQFTHKTEAIVPELESTGESAQRSRRTAVTEFFQDIIAENMEHKIA